MRKIDLVGKVFGRLTVLRENGRQNGKVVWDCLCECGKETSVTTNSLNSGNTLSCGCLRNDSIASRRRTHGMSRSRVYSIWCGIINRCTNTNEPAYSRYGGRGITISEEWRNSFDTFLSDMGYPGKEFTLDRINNEKGYSKENCRWATYKQQARNTRKNKIIEFNGESLCTSEWAERIGITESTLRCRLYRFNWSIEKALTTPSKRKIFM